MDIIFLVVIYAFQAYGYEAFKSDPHSPNCSCKLVDGKFGEWSGFNNCSKTCGGGIKYRTRKCDSPLPANGGKYCEGESADIQTCNQHNCPVNGGFGEWSAFTSCSKTCGKGEMTRTRKCVSPKPQHGGKDCVGVKTEKRECNIKPCAVDGGFGAWSAFGTCSKTCGYGVKLRTRKCDSPKPEHGGKHCVGKTMEGELCNTNPCQVNGGFSSWTSFSSCSKSCGGGVKTRTRKCDSPAPASGGESCVGIDRHSISCNSQNCPDWLPTGKYHNAEDGFSYRLYKQKVNWNIARDRCLQDRAHLVFVKTNATAKFVHSLRARFWMGAHRQPDDFRWLDGSPLTIQNWARGEPSGHNRWESCLESFGTGKWNDNQCDQGREWSLCQKKI